MEKMIIATGLRINNDIGNGSNFALNYFTSIDSNRLSKK